MRCIRALLLSETSIEDLIRTLPVKTTAKQFISFCILEILDINKINHYKYNYVAHYN